MSVEPPRMKLLGLRNDVLTKEDCFNLLLYDIDKTPLTDSDIYMIDKLCCDFDISYLLYSTKHGYHLVGLTPLTPIQWGNAFTSLKIYFNSYYCGKTIRLSRKKDEIQKLIKLETSYGKVINNLYNLYASRFGYTKLPWIKETSKYLLVFEKYRSAKE